VSYHADNSVEGFAVYSTVAINRQTGWFNAYGDSAGAPQWGALVAIANQQRVAAGLPTLDGASQVLPGLYALANLDYGAYYHDVTSGGNSKYSAGAGYDLVTGLGTPKADALVPALASLTGSGTSVAFPPPSGGSGFGGTGEIGGGFDILDPAAPALPPDRGSDRPAATPAAEAVLGRSELPAAAATKAKESRPGDDYFGALWGIPV
jgi:hypothetical protein